MASTNTNSNFKKQLKQFSLNGDISTTIAFNLFAKKVVYEHCIPFEIENDVPNKLTEKTIKDARNGVGLSKSYSSVKELIGDLNADEFETSLREDVVDEFVKSVRRNKHKWEYNLYVKIKDYCT